MSETVEYKPSSSSIALAILAVISLFALFSSTLYATALICWEKEDYSHGLLLPLISAYFIWENRKTVLARMKPNSDTNGFNLKLLVGVSLLVSGVLLHFVGQLANILFISWLGFFPAFVGAVLLIFGLQGGAMLIGPILLLYMAKPLPDSLVPRLFFPLQVLAAKISAWVLKILDVPVYLMGNVIEIPGMKLMVEEACSGLRSLMALLTVAVIVLFTVEMAVFAKVTIVLLAVGIAVALNILRVATTGVLAHFYDPEAASGFFHSFSGMIVFGVGLFILYYCGLALQKLSSK